MYKFNNFVEEVELGNKKFLVLFYLVLYFIPEILIAVFIIISAIDVMVTTFHIQKLLAHIKHRIEPSEVKE